MRGVLPIVIGSSFSRDEKHTTLRVRSSAMLSAGIIRVLKASHAEADKNSYIHHVKVLALIDYLHICINYPFYMLFSKPLFSEREQQLAGHVRNCVFTLPRLYHLDK